MAAIEVFGPFARAGLGLGAILLLGAACGGSSGEGKAATTTATLAMPGPPTTGVGAPPTTSTLGSCRVDDLSDPGANHVLDPTYRVDPPAGGDHAPIAAAAGVYIGGNVPPDGELVHALEHGYVILWFRTDLGEADAKTLLAVAARTPDDVLVVARASLPVPVAATAWHRRLLCPGFDGSALAAFVDRWRNQGPERIPH